jgi:hypothetical protein
MDGNENQKIKKPIASAKQKELSRLCQELYSLFEEKQFFKNPDLNLFDISGHCERRT